MTIRIAFIFPGSAGDGGSISTFRAAWCLAPFDEMTVRGIVVTRAPEQYTGHRVPLLVV